MRRILVVRNDRFGEFLLNIPAFRALKETFPGAQITLIADPLLVGLTGSIPYVDEVLFWKMGKHFMLQKVIFWWKLASRRFDAAIIFNPTKAMNIFTYLAAIPIRAGYSRKWDFLLTRTILDTKYKGDKHEVIANLELVSLLGAKTANRDPEIKINNYFKRRWLVAIHPFTSDSVKQWPMERFSELAQRLAKLGFGQVVVVGKPERNAVVTGFIRDGIMNMVSKTSLKQLAVILKQSKVLVSCDSGPVHLACCVNTPVVALFRNDMPGKNPQRWGPWGENNRVIQKPSLKDISVDEVEKAVLDICANYADAKLPTCDIIIPVYNQLDYTKNCIESIKSNTLYPHKLIILDDASQDPTRNYLQKLAAKGKITLVNNEKNLGWLSSVNRELEYSKADYVCVMNNDVEVYPGWLEEMISALEAEDNIGLVNPEWEMTTNHFRQTRKKYYEMEISGKCGEYIETNWARGFCFLVKRKVIEKIGVLNTTFDPGYYDDWDYSLRAIKAGFIPVRAQGAFVWHYKNVTYEFELGKKGLNDLLFEKSKIFYKKWGESLRFLVLLDDSWIVNYLKDFLRVVLREQNRIVAIGKKKDPGIAHTNFTFLKRFFMFPFVLFILYDDLRHKKTKRYDLIICSEVLKNKLERFPFLKKSYRIIPLEFDSPIYLSFFDKMRGMKEEKAKENLKKG